MNRISSRTLKNRIVLRLRIAERILYWLLTRNLSRDRKVLNFEDSISTHFWNFWDFTQKLKKIISFDVFCWQTWKRKKVVFTKQRPSFKLVLKNIKKLPDLREMRSQRLKKSFWISLCRIFFARIFDSYLLANETATFWTNQ